MNEHFVQCLTLRGQGFQQVGSQSIAALDEGVPRLQGDDFELHLTPSL